MSTQNGTRTSSDLATTVGCAMLSPFVPGCAAYVAGVRMEARAAEVVGDAAAAQGGGLFSGLGDAVRGVGEEANQGLNTILYTTIAVGAIVALIVFAFIAFMVWHEFFRV